MIKELGELLGWLIVISYVLASNSYIIKLVNKKYYRQINKNSTVRKIFNKTMRSIIKNHRLFGFSAVTFILIHFIIQFTNYGLSKKGLLAALLMIIQVGLGIHGTNVDKKYRSLWLFFHRAIALLLLFAILRHLL